MIDEFIFDRIPDKYDNPIRLATVVSFSGTSAEIKFDGEESSGKKYRMLTTYIPSIGDRVLVAKISGSAVILGSIKK